jgi:hypothetical protein
MNLREMYKLFSYTMPPDQFREYINPQNEVCKLLQAHFVALQLIMTPITKNEWAGRESHMEADLSAASVKGGSARWLAALHSNIPVPMLKYYQWTLWVEQEVQQGRVYDGRYSEDV